MACNWLMMTSSGDDNRPSGSLGLLTNKTKKKNNKNKPKAEQETAQPTAARFNKTEQHACMGMGHTVDYTCIYFCRVKNYRTRFHSTGTPHVQSSCFNIFPIVTKHSCNSSAK